MIPVGTKRILHELFLHYLRTQCNLSAEQCSYISAIPYEEKGVIEDWNDIMPESQKAKAIYFDNRVLEQENFRAVIQGVREPQIIECSLKDIPIVPAQPFGVTFVVRIVTV